MAEKIAAGQTITFENLQEVSQAWEDYHAPAYASARYFAPAFHIKHKFPNSGMPAHVTQQFIRDKRMFDANPRLNLASFVTTWMEPECDAVVEEARNVNYIDEAEYPSTTEIQNHCVSMLADLWHAEDPQHPTGTSTIGSSEAILLAGLAFKRRWQDRRKKEGKPYNKPNIVMGSEVHVCWEKLTNYFEVEPKYINISPDTHLPDPQAMIDAVDENTIGIASILGSTYTGEFEQVEQLSKLLAEKNKEKGWDVGIHVDGASGGFVAPFIFPNLKWDFQLPNVHSINASGHKFGLVYPGLGWCIFRSKKYLPESLIFHDSYLGIDQISFTLNFSKSAAPIVAQYYQFLRLGRAGYTKMITNMHNVAVYLKEQIDELDHFRTIKNEFSLPLVAFSLTQKGEEADDSERQYTEFDVADRMRERGWVVPAYSLAPGAESITVLRALCREDFTMQTADMFVSDLKQALGWLDAHFIFTPEQLNKVKQNRRDLGKEAVPLGPHGSARPNQQTIEDLRKHDAPQTMIQDKSKRNELLDALASKVGSSPKPQSGKESETKTTS